MRLYLLITLLLAGSVLADPLPVVSSDPDGAGPWPAAQRVEGRLLLQFKQPISTSELEFWGQLRGLQPRWTSFQGAKSGLAYLDINETKLASVISSLDQDPFLRHITPDYVVTVHSQNGPLANDPVGPSASFPNDPRFKDQWHLKMMKVPKTWKKKVSGSGVRIALVDSGVANRDKGGVKAVEDLVDTEIEDGYDFIDQDHQPVDRAGYGTHSAGVLAQSTNNKIGTAGIAFSSTLIPVRVLNEEGQGSFATVSDGIRYAADQGAQVIVMGFGSSVDSQLVEDACLYAADKGCLLIGSGGVDGGDEPGYPAAYEDVLGVGAVDNSRQATSYSNKGVDITAPGGYAAPGNGILQNTIHPKNPRRSGYVWMAGTNCAAACVGGVAAQVISCGITDPKEVREILLTTTKKKRDKKSYGAGIVLADKAVNKALKRTKDRNNNEFDKTGLYLLGFLLLGLLGLRRSDVL